MVVTEAEFADAHHVHKLAAVCDVEQVQLLVLDRQYGQHSPCATYGLAVKYMNKAAHPAMSLPPLNMTRVCDVSMQAVWSDANQQKPNMCGKEQDRSQNIEQVEQSDVTLLELYGNFDQIGARDEVLRVV